MAHPENATIYGESSKRRIFHSFLVGNLHNNGIELTYVVKLLYQGVDGKVLEERDLVPVAKGPEASENLERREFRRLGRVLGILDIA